VMRRGMRYLLIVGVLLAVVSVGMLAKPAETQAATSVVYGLDIGSWTSNPYTIINAAKAKGFGFMGCYLTSPTKPYKVLTRARLAALQNSNMPFFLFFEESRTRPNRGYWAGVADARKVIARLKYLDLPRTTPVYFCNDWGGFNGRVVAYYRGVRDTFGFPQGAYGGGILLTYLFDHGLIKYGCQVWFWSRGWEPRAQLIQSYSIRVANRTCGISRTTGKVDFGQIPRPTLVTAPTPPITTTTTEAPTTTTTESPTTTTGATTTETTTTTETPIETTTTQGGAE
jgi:hypothetical protein